MKYARLSSFLLFVLALAGCGDSTPPPAAPKNLKAPEDDRGGKTKQDKDDEEDHDHGVGPHGGSVFDFGKHHAEFAVSHPKKEVTIYILSGNQKKAVAVEAKELTLSIKEPKFDVKLMPSPDKDDPKGKSSRFTGTDDRFGKEQVFEGTLSGEVDGIPMSGECKGKTEVPKKK